MEEVQIDVKVAAVQDISLIAEYWASATDDYLVSLGVDLSKRIPPDKLMEFLSIQWSLPYSENQAYPVIWWVNNRPAGHCNINMISFADQAHMHLHMWKPDLRGLGYGADLVKLSLSFFFKNFKLKKIICEPYASNDAPNKTLAKAGFTFVKEYITIPGAINFEQPVKQWIMTLEDFENSL